MEAGPPSSENQDPDALEGMPDRTHFDTQIDHEWRRGTRDGSSLALLMIALDEGQASGDEPGPSRREASLERLATTLRRTLCRPGDLVARYSEVQFAVVLPNTDTVGALLVAETLHKAMKALPVASYTYVSLGVASLVPPRDRPFDILVAAADQALRNAREQGGNRIQHSVL